MGHTSWLDIGLNFADGLPKDVEFLGAGEDCTGYLWFWNVSRFSTILQLRCSLIHSVLQASTPLSFTSFCLKLGKLNKGTISFQLVQSTPIHNEVSKGKDGILSHSPGTSSRGSGALQGSLSWGIVVHTKGWGPIGELFFPTQRLELLTERNPILSFLSFWEAERAGESGKPVAGVCLGAVGASNKQD